MGSKFIKFNKVDNFFFPFRKVIAMENVQMGEPFCNL